MRVLITPNPARGSSKAALCAYGMAGVMTAAIVYDLTRMPLQALDSLAAIFDAQAAPSMWAAIVHSVNGYGYLRPGFIAQVKLLFDVSGGHYVLAYKAFHISLIVAFFWLFVRALRVQDRRDAVAASLALLVFAGIHTFLGTVKETYPIQHFLEVSVLCLAALNLAESRGGWLVDITAALAFLLAALTVESGLLVWVVLAAAWAVGLRGVSTRGIILVTALLAVYVTFRVGVLEQSIPALTERSSGYLLREIEPAEIQQRFGANPIGWYTYNVASSALSVLVSQPRSGVWIIVNEWLAGTPQPRSYINLAASLSGTALIAWFVVGRLRRGVRWPPARGEQHVLVFAAVLAANCLVSFWYTKDEILTTAGAFYALAVFWAARELLERVDAHPPSPIAAAALAVLLLAGSLAWSIKAVGVHHVLAEQAFRHRSDWARLPQEWQRQGFQPTTPAALELTRVLRDEALARRATNPYFLPRWAGRIFDADY